MPDRRVKLSIDGFTISVDRHPLSIARRYERGIDCVKLSRTTFTPRGYRRRFDVERRGKLLVYKSHRYHPLGSGPLVDYIHDYKEACRAMDRTDAGRRARDLLFTHLSEAQLQTVERYGYFDVALVHPKTREVVEEEDFRGALDISVALFRIWRGYAAGNVELFIFNPDINRPKPYTLCVHPVAPYPTDDIHLAQKLMAEFNPDELLAQANVTQGLASYNFHRLYESESGRRERLGSVELPPMLDIMRDRSWRRPTRREEVLAYIDAVLG